MISKYQSLTFIDVNNHNKYLDLLIHNLWLNFYPLPVQNTIVLSLNEWLIKQSISVKKIAKGHVSPRKDWSILRALTH